MNSSAESPNKKVYEAPRLSNYGSLTEMTAALSTGTGMDMMTGPTKSH